VRGGSPRGGRHFDVIRRAFFASFLMLYGENPWYGPSAAPVEVDNTESHLLEVRHKSRGLGVI